MRNQIRWTAIAANTVKPAARSTPCQAPPAEHVPVPLFRRVATVLAVVIPPLGFLAAFVLLWGHGFSWVPMGLLVGMYLLTAFGITVGYHRLFTHRSFETSAAVRFILAVLGSMALEGPVLKWAAIHRRHHQHSDDTDDPHSPHQHGDGFLGSLAGVWHAHMGWIFEGDPVGLARYVKDLSADPVISAVSNTWALWATVGLLLPALLGGLITWSWTGAFLGFIWGGLARLFLVHHVTWSINSVCHIWGSRPYNSHDESRNNVLFGILGMGEGWHNNHHAFPNSARHGLRWWQIDLSYWFIRGLESIGMAWKVRVPAVAAMQVRLRSNHEHISARVG